MHTTELTSANFENTAEKNGIVFIDWWASWCGPCRAFAPIYERVAAQHPDIVWGKIDTDAEQQLAGGFGIRSIPTLMVFRDGILIFFNDPLPIDDPCGRAARMALAMQEAFAPLAQRWGKLGHDLGLGIGIARGYATLGAVGYEGRFDYSAIGSVVNLSARLCGEAKGGHVLVDRRAQASLEERFALEPVEALVLKGFDRPVAAFRLVGER